MFLHFCSVQIAHAVMDTSSHTAYRIHMNSCNVTRSLDWTIRVGTPWQSTFSSCDVFVHRNIGACSFLLHRVYDAEQ